MKINEIFLLINALSIAFGFSQNRTEWSMAPQLDPRQKPSEQVKDIRIKASDNILKSSLETKLLGSDNLTTMGNSLRRRFDEVESSSEKEEDFIIDLISEAKSKSGVNHERKIAKAFAKKSSGFCPSNVILILIDGLDRVEQHLRMDLEQREIFPVQGVLQSCATNSSPFRLTRSAECDCEDELKSNIASLLTWARLEKKKSTSTLYEMPPIYSNRMEYTKSFASHRMRRNDRQLHEYWQLKKMLKSRLARSLSSSNVFRKEEQMDSHDHEEIMWHVSDVLSRLRDAFFRSLMSAGGASPFEPSFLRRLNLRELASSTFEELTSMSDQRGYVMLATTGPAEILDVVELARRYGSQQNSLVVVMSTCPRDNIVGMRYYACGPGSAQLAEANPADLDALFEAVRVIVSASACQDSAVKMEDQSAMLGVAQPLLLLQAEPEALRSPRRVRLARVNPAEHVHHNYLQLENLKANAVKMTGKRNNDTHGSEELAVRIGDFSNSQEINSPLVIIYVTVLTISITYTIKY